uniref:Pentatricopeptide repeat-containing protein n=1 Tax=Nelumbo nucifera TaxID=4432 RepID=A0A822YHK2_NELNU|nr:TPA_asm: hypothetical protein HUJ06_010838 [Nelumbo nucifera]
MALLGLFGKHGNSNEVFKLFQEMHCINLELLSICTQSMREKQRESLKVSKLDTPDSGKVFQYWHCCGSEDLFDPGCTASPHSSYDD